MLPKANPTFGTHCYSPKSDYLVFYIPFIFSYGGSATENSLCSLFYLKWNKRLICLLSTKLVKIGKVQKIHKHTITQKDIQRTFKHMKRCSNPFTMEEMKIKNTLRYYFISIK